MQVLQQRSALYVVHRPEPIGRHWIEAVHEAGYVAEVLECRVPREKERRIGFPVTERVAQRALLSPGGTWLAAKLAMRFGYAANAAGGSHHALADTGAGYCVFNDLVVAANRLIAEGDAQRILIIDLDVHQGDGTAALTVDRDDIFTFSMHAAKNFPVRKARSSCDVELADGTGDAEYLAVLEAHLPPIFERFAPDMILYQAGVDPHCEDRLGRLSLSDAGLQVRDRLVMQLAIKRGLPLASTLGGGYGADRMAVAGRHVASMLALTDELDRASERDPARC